MALGRCACAGRGFYGLRSAVWRPRRAGVGFSLSEGLRTRSTCAECGGKWRSSSSRESESSLPYLFVLLNLCPEMVARPAGLQACPAEVFGCQGHQAACSSAPFPPGSQGRIHGGGAGQSGRPCTVWVSRPFSLLGAGLRPGGADP